LQEDRRILVTIPGTLNSSMGHSSHGGQELCVGHSSGSGDEGSGGLSVIDGHSEHSLGQGLLVIRGQVGVGQEGQVGQGRGVAVGEQVTGGGQDGHSGVVGVGIGAGDGFSLRQYMVTGGCDKGPSPIAFLALTSTVTGPTPGAISRG
jgi:hypothetical protein